MLLSAGALWRGNNILTVIDPRKSLTGQPEAANKRKGKYGKGIILKAERNEVKKMPLLLLSLHISPPLLCRFQVAQEGFNFKTRMKWRDYKGETFYGDLGGL